MGDDLARGERSQVPVNRWAETQNTSPIAFPYVKKKEPWVPSPPTQTPDQWLASQQAKRQNASVANNTRGNAPMMVAQNQPDVGGYWQTDYNVYPGSKPGSIKLIGNQDNLGDAKGVKNKVWPFDDKSDDKGALPINEPIPMGFNGQIVRRDAKGKQVTIPFKKGVPVKLQPGDQIQQFNPNQPDKKKLTPQQQRDEAIKKMSYGDKLIGAAKMVPDLLKGDAKAAYQKMVSDPGFVAQLVAVSAVFAALQATPAGPLIDGALVAYLGFSAGFSLAGYLLKTGSAQNEAGLKSAATDLKDLVEVVGIAGLGAVLGNAGRVLRALQGTSKVAGKVLKGDSLIVDSNVFVAKIFKAQNSPEMHAGHRAALERMKQLGLLSSDIRATDTTATELSVKFPKLDLKKIAISVDRNSSEYRSLLKNLENPDNVFGMTVGRAKGIADRNIVADVFFAKTQAGVIPRYATADANIYKPLARRAGIVPERLNGKKIPEVYPNGFEVSINGKVIHVFPLPGS
jgi:hypothetical protein